MQVICKNKDPTFVAASPILEQPAGESNLMEQVYECPDSSCQKQYVRSSSLEKHLSIGNHQYRKSEETGIDSGIKILAEKCSTIRQKYCQIMENVTSENHGDTVVVSKGWALKSISKSTKFSQKVKEYVQQIFDSCEKSGKRL